MEKNHQLFPFQWRSFLETMLEQKMRKDQKDFLG